jgi:hypothetical protein
MNIMKNILIIFLTALFNLMGLNTKAQGTALSFNGVDNSTGSRLTGTVPSGTNKTIEMDIFYKGGNNGYDRVFSTPGNDFEIAISNLNTIRIYRVNPGGWVDIGYTIPLNTWVHLSFVKSGSTVSLYVNGVLCCLTNNVISNFTFTQFRLGANFNNDIEGSNVNIDNFRIWNTARTAAQITENYQRCLLGNETNLVVYYNFDEGSGSTVTDLTGNGNTGTLTNSPGWVTGVNCTYNCNPTYSGGAGTLANPYLISNLNDLRCLSTTITDWNKHFLQTANINANVTFGWNNNTGFSPIGNTTTSFTGVYDGNNFTISNLNINRPTNSHIGLFGLSGNSNISNVTLTGVNITGEHRVGALIGSAEGTTISNNNVSGTVNAQYAVGGLVGWAENSNISGSAANINVNAIRPALNTSFSDAGGLVGDLSSSTITNCSASGNLNVNGRNVGGLVGWIEGASSINRSFATGNIVIDAASNQEEIGGLVGTSSGTAVCSITNCYARGNVTIQNVASVNTGIGGLIGRIRSPGTSFSVNNCYSLGQVTGLNSTAKGGLIGIRSSASVNNSFWDTQTSGLATSSGGTGRTTAQMKNIGFYRIANWDFQCETTNGTNDFWGINNGIDYPELSWTGFTQICPGTCSANVINATANQTQVCEGSSTTITVSNSEVGASYYLRNVSNDSIVHGPVLGTGGNISLNTEVITSPKNYYVYAEKNGIVQVTSNAIGITGSPRMVNLGTQMWNNEFAGRNQITVEAWIFRTSTGNLNTVISNYQSSYRLLFRIWSDNKIQFILNDFAVGVTSTSTIPANTWTHVTGVYNGTTASIYINGILDSSLPYTGTLLTSSVAMKIGGGLTNGTEFFQGNISEVRLWNIARTPAEITSSYTKQLTGNEFGLIGYYQFNEGTGTTTANNAKNGLYNGTLVSSPTWTVGNILTESNCFEESAQNYNITAFPAPSNLNANNITSTSADLSWISLGTNFQIEYGNTGYSLGNGTKTITNNNPFQLTGLNVNTTYDFYVRQICGPGDTTAWSSSYSFTTLLATNTWTGNQNNNWNNANNWSNGVPGSGQNILIQSGAGNYPEIELGVNINNLTIQNNASLTVKNNQTLTVNGTLTNNGTITVESGGALVQGISSTLAGTGNYIVRRAVNAGQKMVGSPINNHSASSFGVTPTGANGGQIIPQADCNATSIDPSSPYGDIMELREDASPIHNCTQSLWHVKSAGNLTNARGYAVNIAANATLEFSGTINNGNISYANLGRQANLLDQPSTGQQTGGWHLVSNPYPSPIRLINNSLGAGWDNSVYFFDGTNFVTSQLILADAVIPVGQAFQIRKSAVGGSANFNVTNSMREGGNPTFYAPAQLTQEHINVTLSNNQYQSKTTVYFEDGATSNFDPQFDAVKLFGAHYLPQLYTVETSALAEKLAYNALTPLYQENQQSVVMGAFTPTVGDFQLTFDGSNTVSGTVVLEDKKLNTFTNITENLTYSFTTVDGDNMDRFVLHFDATPDNTSAISKMEGTIKMFPNPSADFTTLIFPEKHPFNTINIVDLSGRTINTFEIKNQTNTLQIDTKKMSKGIYFVQILSASNTEVLKLMVK